MNNRVTTSGNRIRELIEYLGISLSQMSIRTGIEKSSLSHYINGKRTPRQDRISIIAEKYNVNPAWLMGYDVPMKDKPEATDRLLAYYRKLSELKPNEQEIIFNQIDFLRERKDEKD